jgi:hypothetical protein
MWPLNQPDEHHPLDKGNRLGLESSLRYLRHHNAAAFDEKTEALIGFQRIQRVVRFWHTCSSSSCQNNNCLSK